MAHSKDEKETQTHLLQDLLLAMRDRNRVSCKHRFRPEHHRDTHGISQCLTCDLEDSVAATQEGMAR